MILRRASARSILTVQRIKKVQVGLWIPMDDGDRFEGGPADAFGVGVYANVWIGPLIDFTRESASCRQ